jgi:hypothetical protein
MEQAYKNRLHAIAQELLLHAAAPDLLKALQFALARLEEAARERHYDYKAFDSDANDVAIIMAQEVIEKATGVKKEKF